jgi:hypothetical protein
MRPEERLAEVAAILARGFARSHYVDHEPVINPTAYANDISAEALREDGNPLALLDHVEPSCSHAVNSRENEGVA